MDEAEFVELVPVLGRRLRRTAYLMSGSWATAEDAAQEGLVRVFLALPRIERKGGFEAYARSSGCRRNSEPPSCCATTTS